ncbi:hypothetical protein ONE63_004961 [Megalurothrips usitatus]|uniref:Uncharacterized protein n=1 Tax=Megalurothrips usitatus TaxID=439358 RepID=A0AAV7X1D0_9NEOP|nr:hypothetical protein ONE63_004961 [Megalurothrips usitatus]
MNGHKEELTNGHKEELTNGHKEELTNGHKEDEAVEDASTPASPLSEEAKVNGDGEHVNGEANGEELKEEDAKKKDKSKKKKKWSFRSISFSKKDKSKPTREDKSGEIAEVSVPSGVRALTGRLMTSRPPPFSASLSSRFMERGGAAVCGGWGWGGGGGGWRMQ